MKRLTLILALSLLVCLSFALQDAHATCSGASFNNAGVLGETTVDIIPDVATTATGTLSVTCVMYYRGGREYYEYNYFACFYIDSTVSQTLDDSSYYLTDASDGRLAWSMARTSTGAAITRFNGGLATFGFGCYAGKQESCTNSMPMTLTYLARSQQDRVRPGSYNITYNGVIGYGTAPDQTSASTWCTPSKTFTGTNFGTYPFTFTVKANVLAKCQLEGLTNVAFGTVGSGAVASAGAQALGSIGVRCTYTTPYSITLGDGLNVSGGVRRMKSGANYIAYKLLQPGCATDWSTASALSGIGTTVNTLNSHTVCGQIITPIAVTPPAGTYTDTVVVTATF